MTTTERPEVFTAAVSAEDRAQLHALITHLEDGFNSKEAAVLDRPFARDAVIVVPDGTLIRGWDDLFAYHTERLANAASTWKTQIRMLSVAMLDRDTAVAHFRQDTTIHGGAFANHGTFVAVRRSGAWWIAALHNTNILD
ncbi:SgcJ/EcaC family oxidoreductase [Nocardia sp. NPDC005978]|uniref:YybH family protein n=1 Tax=Nocardia sp. NPDC005978 TaxID=3156725 RepID=UPI0033B892A8